jgi:hypothetical protein
MNLSNPLPPIRLAYETAQESFRVARRAIKTQQPTIRQRLLQRTQLETQTLNEAEHLITQNIQKPEKPMGSSLRICRIKELTK